MKPQILIITILICLIAVATYAEEPKTLSRTADVVIIKAAGFGPLLGRPISSLRAYAAGPQGFKPIPYQIDERDAKNRLVFPYGPKAGKDEDNGLLDANDELVFMIKDAGGKADPSEFPKGYSAAVTIDITDPIDGGKSWVYLLDFNSPPPPSPIDYVRFDPVNNMIYAANYVMGFDKKAPIGIGYLALTPEGGGNGKNYIDRLKIRFKATTLGGTVKIDRNEEQFTCKVVAWIDGPVRVIRHTENRMILILNIPTPSAMLDNVYYFNHFEFPTEVSIPFDVDTLISNPEFRVSTDALCSAAGMTFRNEKNPKPVLIDGVMSEEEKKLDHSKYKWMAVTVPPPNKGAWINWLIYDKKTGALPELFYADDKTTLDPPENEPGQCCNVGYMLKGMSKMKKGVLRLNSIMYNIPVFTEDKITEYLNILDHPLIATVGSIFTP